VEYTLSSCGVESLAFRITELELRTTELQTRAPRGNRTQELESTSEGEKQVSGAPYLVVETCRRTADYGAEISESYSCLENFPQMGNELTPRVVDRK